MSAQGLFVIAVLFVPLGHLNALSLQSPGLAHCPSLAQSQVQPSHVSICRFNRAPGQARPVGSAGQGRPPPPRLLASSGGGSAWRPVSPLHLGICPFCGQQRSVWKCSSDSPLRRLNTSSNPGLFSQRHLRYPPLQKLLKWGQTIFGLAYLHVKRKTETVSHSFNE